jgi:hypothetical protein
LIAHVLSCYSTHGLAGWDWLPLIAALGAVFVPKKKENGANRETGVRAGAGKIKILLGSRCFFASGRNKDCLCSREDFFDLILRIYASGFILIRLK